jgi:3-phosphoshikimate 1-carboxyvinyltransferase
MRRVSVPGDKSISHRSLLFAALAHGTSRLRGVLCGEDPRSTAGVLRALGVSVPDPDGAEIIIESDGWRSWRQPTRDLDCGNSGTTARLMLGALAGLPLRARLDGDASLRRRPMDRVTAPLERMGARFEAERQDGRLPLVVHGGRLQPLVHTSPIASAQVKSALLLAGITGGAPVTVDEPLLSRDHSERMLAAMGVTIRSRVTAAGARIELDAPNRLLPLDIDVPGDFSSAAFVIGHALLSGIPLVIGGVGVNPTRTGLLGVLERMGARITLEHERHVSGEPVADVVVVPGRLKGGRAGGAEIPAMIDEVPMLAVLATRAEGETRVHGAGELRIKESDRIAAIVENIRQLGGNAVELSDGLVVNGTDRPLRGRVQSHGDHRIAMAFSVLGMARDNDIEIDDPALAGISFPGFHRLLASLSPGEAAS